MKQLKPPYLSFFIFFATLRRNFFIAFIKNKTIIHRLFWHFLVLEAKK